MLTLPNHPVPHSVTPPTDRLAGRVAQCSYCGKEAPSSNDLAFFNFRGDGSKDAVDGCGNCNYRYAAHDRAEMEKNVKSNRRTVIERGLCPGFVSRGAMATDLYYCGCAGWD